MHRVHLTLLGLALLCIGTAAMAADFPPPPAAAMSPATGAVSPLFPLEPSLGPSQSVPLTCTTQGGTTCYSCLYFGEKTSYECTTFCINGVLHRTCNTCGEGCLN
jgi:hypothetical protein